MLQQILTNTPLWVWAVLAFLLYRGLLASVDRHVGLKRIFLIPLVMLALSLQGMVSAFGADIAAAPVWVIGMLVGTALAWWNFDRASVAPDPVRGVVFLRGSWMPMLWMTSVFCIKYMAGAALAIHPALHQQTLFVAGVCTLYGLFNGVFIGQALRTAVLYRQAALSTPAAGRTMHL